MLWLWTWNMQKSPHKCDKCEVCEFESNFHTFLHPFEMSWHVCKAYFKTSFFYIGFLFFLYFDKNVRILEICGRLCMWFYFSYNLHIVVILLLFVDVAG